MNINNLDIYLAFISYFIKGRQLEKVGFISIQIG